MANFTPEELERYKEWAESFKDPQMSSVDDVLEAQREAQAASELVSRGERAAGRSLGTLGELAKGVKSMRAAPSISPAEASAKVFEEAGSELPKNIAEDIIAKQSRLGKSAAESAKLFESAISPAAESARVFEETGSALPKNIAENIVKSQSVPGKTAELSADVLAPKELPTVSNYATPREKKLFDALLKQAQSEMGATGETVVEAADQNAPKNLPATIKRGVPAVIDDFIETTGRTIDSVPEPSRLSKLSKFLPALGKGATALGAAASAYDFSKGNLVEGGLTGIETLLGNVSPRIAAPLELLRPTATVFQEEEQAELDRLKRSNILANLQKRGLAEESVGSDVQLASKKPQQFDYAVPERPTPLLPSNNTEKSVSEIKSVGQQKSSPVPKSSISTGVGEDESPEAKLNEAIKAESAKPQKAEIDFNEMLRMAQEARDKGILLGNIGKAAETFATGLTGTVKGGVVTKPVSTDFYDKLIKQAEQPVEDVGTAYTMKTKQDEMQRLARRRDPASEESKFARDLLKQQGITVPEAATAEALEKYAPQLTNILNQREAREARAENARQRALDRAALLEKGYSEKQEKAIIAARDQVMTKGYKDAFDMYKNAERISNTFENLSAGMYGDTIRTLQSAKLFQGDSSVVRGPELKEIQSAVGVLDRLKNEVDRLGGTAKLQPKQRKQLLDAVNTIKNVAKKEYTGLLGPAAKQFNRRGLPLEEIFDSRVLPEVQESLGIKSEKEEQKIKKAIDGGYNKKTNQTQFIYEDGTSEIVDGNRTSEIVGVKR